MSNQRKCSIYIDGSSKLHLDNKPGTCAYVVVENEQVLHQKAFRYENTTNNRMELCGLDQALGYIMNNIGRAVDVTIYTDSQYVRKGILEWVDKWKQNGWKTATGKDVLNADLWQPLHHLYHSINNIKLEWCKGHVSSNKFNNIADKLCTEAYTKAVREPEKNLNRSTTPTGNTVENLEWTTGGATEGMKMVVPKVKKERAFDRVKAKITPEKREQLDEEYKIAVQLETANQLLLELYNAILTDTNPEVVIMKMGVYLGKNKLI